MTLIDNDFDLAASAIMHLKLRTFCLWSDSLNLQINEYIKG